MKKIFIFILLLILLVSGGAIWFLGSDKLNNLIAEQIQLQGSKYTEQSVTVKKVDMQLLHGAGTINGLVLNNPKGYSPTPAFSLNKTTLDINIQSLGGTTSGGPIVIDAIVIDSPEALVEFNETGGSNIQVILDAINKNLPKSSGTSQPSNETTSRKADPKVRVKKFVLAGVALRVDLTKLGNTTHKKTLPDINLSDIGGEAGLPASELGGELLKRALSGIWKSAKKEQEKVLKDQIKDKAKSEASKLFNKWTKDN